MKNTPRLAIMLLLMSFVVPACGSSALNEVVPPVETVVSTEPIIVETATATSTIIPASSPTPTTAPLQLEILQSQVWTDRDGNVRVNVLAHNPYDFPVAPAYRARARSRT